MQELSEYTKRHWDVVVIGGGATGAGTLRDLAMRGVKALLLEQRDLVHGTSSRFHGLLHSGARYAVKDAEAGRECIGKPHPPAHRQALRRGNRRLLRPHARRRGRV